jgi:hypothetical protein
MNYLYYRNTLTAKKNLQKSKSKELSGAKKYRERNDATGDNLN